MPVAQAASLSSLSSWFQSSWKYCFFFFKFYKTKPYKLYVQLRWPHSSYISGLIVLMLSSLPLFLDSNRVALYDLQINNPYEQLLLSLKISHFTSLLCSFTPAFFWLAVACKHFLHFPKEHWPKYHTAFPALHSSHTASQCQVFSS